MPAMEVVAPEKPPYKNVSDEHIFSVGAGYDLAFGTLTKLKNSLYLRPPCQHISPVGRVYVSGVDTSNGKQLIFAPPFLAYFPGGEGYVVGVGADTLNKICT